MRARIAYKRPLAARHRAAVPAVALALALLALPAPAAGTVVTLSHTRAELAGQPARTGFYDYATATPRTWTTQAEFTAGTLAGTRDDLVAGSLTLDPIGPPGTTLPDLATAWWDKDWATRHCYDVDHTAPGAASVDQYHRRTGGGYSRSLMRC